MSDFSVVEDFPRDIFSSITENISHLAYRFRGLEVNAVDSTGLSQFYWETVQNTAAGYDASTNISVTFGNGTNQNKLLDFGNTPIWSVTSNTAQTVGWIFNSPVSFTKWGIEAVPSGSTKPITKFVLEYSDDTTNGTDGNWFICAVIDDPALINGTIKYYYIQDYPVFIPTGDLAAIEQSTDIYFDNTIGGSFNLVEPADNFSSIGTTATYGTFNGSELLRDTFLVPDIRILSNEHIVKRKIECLFSSQNLGSKLIPVEYLSLSYRLSSKSSFNLTIPNGILYSSYLVDISNDNGSLVVRYIDVLNDGSEEITESLNYSVDSVGSFRGGRNWSVNVGGSAQFNGKTFIQKIALNDVSFIRTSSNGSFLIRSSLDRRLIPGDKAIYNNVEYDVSDITQICRSNIFYMEISTLGSSLIGVSNNIFNVVEALNDTLSFSGTSGINGSFNATDPLTDIFNSNGVVIDFGLDAKELLTDQFNSIGAVEINGLFNANELSTDLLNFDGSVEISGSLSSNELLTDLFESNSYQSSGDLITSENSTDSFSSSGATSSSHKAWRLRVSANNGATQLTVSNLYLKNASGTEVANTPANSGNTYYGSASNAEFEPDKAFNNDTTHAANSFWYDDSTAYPNRNVGVVLDVAEEITTYQLAASGHAISATETAKDWFLEYSDSVITDQASWDSATWVIFDTQTNQTGWSPGEIRTF